MSCGAPLVAACPSCGSEIVPGARFCPSCGTAVAGAPAGQETLKLATILFADVVGSTSRAEAMHPEDVRELMASYFDAMSEEIAAQGGTVEKFIGDAIMAVFGVPMAHEDDPLRAVRAGRRMLTKLHDWNLDRADELQMRIGINTGEVLAAGTVGGDLLVTGDAVNVAARLQQAAPPGAILVGERTQRAARTNFLLEEVEPLELKGKVDPIAAWSVSDELVAPGGRGLPGLSAPMVGREVQLKLLIDTFERTRREARPHLVTIIGDAGVGKSRLVREFILEIEPEAKVTAGRCLPYGEAVTMWPLAEILGSEAGLLHNDPPETAFEKIRKLVREAIPQDLAAEPERTATALASTLGLESDSTHAILEPRQALRDLLVAWRALLGAMSRERALVVVVEDIHWADDSMLDVLDYLAENTHGAVFLLCATRPDLFRTRPNWGGGRRNYSSIPLDPLTQGETETLVSYLLDIDELPESATNRILERSEGNPFFLEEIVRHLIDEGALVRRGERWAGSEGIADISVPDTVQAVILARLDLLSAAERHVIQQAAVVGRTFWLGAVQELSMARDLDAILGTLKRRELIEERLTSSMAGDIEYTFKHLLIRDVAYESLPRRERGKAHLSAARWIEDVSGTRAVELAEVLAHHYASAFDLTKDDDLRRRARHYYLTASTNAVKRFALAQARAVGQRAIDLSAAGEERLSALENLGDICHMSFSGDEAWESFSEALDELRNLSSTDDAVLARLCAKAVMLPTRWMGTMQHSVDKDELLRLIAEGLRAAGEGDNRERALLLSARAMMAFRGYGVDHDAAEADALAAVAIAERLDEPDLLSAALDASYGMYFPVRYGPALRAALRRVGLESRLTTTEISDAYNMCAWSSFYVGDYDASIGYGTRGMELARGLDPAEFAHGLTWRIKAKFVSGDWNGALADQVELDSLVKESGRHPPGYAQGAYAFTAFCLELRGRSDEVDGHAELLQIAPRRLDDRDADAGRNVVGGFELGYLARAFAHRGDLNRARDVLVLEINEKFPEHMAAACDLLPLEQDWAAARDLLPLMRRIADEGEVHPLAWFADRLEGQMEADQGDLDQAILLLRASADGFGTLGAVWEEAYSNLLLAETIGKEGRPELYESRLVSALATFQRLGSVTEVSRAEEQLGRIES
jgi:class 3 adenylate cyclase